MHNKCEEWTKVPQQMNIEAFHYSGKMYELISTINISPNWSSICLLSIWDRDCFTGISHQVSISKHRAANTASARTSTCSDRVLRVDKRSLSQAQPNLVGLLVGGSSRSQAGLDPFLHGSYSNYFDPCRLPLDEFILTLLLLDWVCWGKYIHPITLYEWPSEKAPAL